MKTTAALSLLAALAGSALAQGQFSLVPLETPTPSFGALGFATDLSSDGRYLSWLGATTTVAGTWEGFRFDNNLNGSQGIGSLEIGSNFYSEANAISGNGAVVVGLSQVGFSPNRAVAYSFATSTLTPLPDLPGGTGSLAIFCNALAANEAGTILGGYGVPAGNVITACTWNFNPQTGAATVTAVPQPTGLTGRSQINAIGDADGTLRLIGRTGTGANIRAWIKVGSANAVRLLNPADEVGASEAFGISRDGSTVVGYLTSDSTLKPGTWKLQSGVWAPQVLSGGDGIAFDASDNGQYVVGVSGGVATIWINADRFDLATWLQGRGITVPSGVSLLEATAISRDGTVIAGNANQGSNSPVQPFLVVIEPVTPSCPADIGGEGGAQGPDGVLDNNDFIVFIQLFFDQSPLADIGAEGGAEGSDQAWDNNDFIVFIQRFFAGC